MDAYLDRLNRFIFRSGLVMKPIFAAAQNATAKRVVYADGEDERVLRAAQVVLRRPHRPADPDRPAGGRRKPARAIWPEIRPGEDFDLINPENDPRYRDYVDLCVQLVGRRGVTPDAAKMHGTHQHHGDRLPGAAGAARPTR
jgi:malate dehydrogenase (oxaloacetate-decarboxylating)(NADP+)